MALSPAFRVSVNLEKEEKELRQSSSLERWYGWLRRLDMEAFNNRRVKRTVSVSTGRHQARINFPDSKSLAVRLVSTRHPRGEVIWQGSYADITILPDTHDNPVRVDGLSIQDSQVVLYAIYEAFRMKWRF